MAKYNMQKTTTFVWSEKHCKYSTILTARQFFNFFNYSRTSFKIA